MRTLRSQLDWKKGNGLIPAIIQHAETGLVLMLGYMNEQALERTIESQKVWFYSRSKRRLWMKGETSGNTLELVDMRADCDHDTLLIKALPKGPTCHTGSVSCFGGTDIQEIFSELYTVLQDRKQTMPDGSYTTALLKEGLRKICAKVDEESGEVIHAAKHESKKRMIEESVDLLYHLFVLLVHKEVRFSELLGEVRRRRKP